MLSSTNINKTNSSFYQNEYRVEDLDSFFTYLLSERRELEDEVRSLQALYESHLEGKEHTSVVSGVDNMNIDSVKLQLDIARFRLGMVNGYLNNI